MAGLWQRLFESAYTYAWMAPRCGFAHSLVCNYTVHYMRCVDELASDSSIFLQHSGRVHVGQLISSPSLRALVISKPARQQRHVHM